MTRRSPRQLTAPRAVRRAIVAHARAEQPRECCGFLLGHGQRVTHALPMTNVAPGTTRYRIDDRAHLTLRRVLRGMVPVLEIVGVYHSHPAGSAVASPTDIAQAMYPEWTHVIVGLGAARADVRAFQIRNCTAREVRLAWK